MACSIECSNCTYNLKTPRLLSKKGSRYCSKRVANFPNVKGFCVHFKELKEATVTPPVAPPVAPIKPSRHEEVHLQQYVDKKKRDILFSYIYLPKATP